MANSARQLRLLSKRYLPHFAALVVTAIAMAGFLFLSSSEKERNLLRYRSYTLSQLNTTSERLEDIINSSLIHIEGLSAYVSIHPEISRTEFDELAKHIISEHKGIHSIELVKGTVITEYIYPLKSNEKAIGVDLMSLPKDRETISRAIETKKTVITGPINLIQGGTAFIARSPIFISSGKKSSQKDKCWGLAQAIITTKAVFKGAGLYDKSSNLYFAIRGKDAKGAAGDVFFGDKAVFQSNPLIRDIPLFNGSWQMAAVPKAGWESVSAVRFRLRATGALIPFVLGYLVFYFLRSQQNILKSEERHRNIFHNAAVSIWEEDFSDIKKAIDGLKAQGVVDFRKYLDENPEFARKAAQMARVIDVNDATLRLYKAKNTDELLGSLDKIFTPESYTAFKEILIAIAEGRAYFESEAINKNLDGEPFNILITISIPSGTSEFRNLLVSILDITERIRAEEELRLMLSVSHAISRSGNVSITLREAMRQVCETTGWKVGEAWAPDPQGILLEEWAVYYDALDEMAAKFGNSMKQFSFLPGIGLPGRVWTSKKAVWIEDITKDPDFSRADIARETGIRSAIGVPAMFGDELIAVLGFYMTESITENKRFIEPVSAVSSQLGEVFLLKRSEDAIRESEERLRTLYESSRDAVMTLIPDQGFLGGNPAAVALFGCRDEREFTAASPASISPEFQQDGRRSAEKAQEMMRLAFENGSHFFEWTHKRVDGTEFFADVLLTRMEIGGKPLLQATVRDITERKLAEERIKHLAFYDALTGLPNRRMLNDRLSQKLAVSKRSGLYGAIMVLDLDNFKPLNDQYGHAIGDLLLMEVARRLTNCLREVDTVARFGGDEFVVMLGELDKSRDTSKAQAAIVAEKIRSTLSEAYFLKPAQKEQTGAIVEHYCTSSIGVALFEGHEANQDEIFRYADAAMYQAKEDGRNLIRFYNNRGQ